MLIIVLLVGGCGGSTNESTGATLAPDAPPPTAVGAVAGSPPRMLLRSPEWTLKRASDVPTGGPVSAVLPLTTVWFTEYDRAVSYSEVQRLKVSGVEGDLARYVALVTGVGFVLDQVDTPFGPGWVGTTDEAASRPAVLAFGSEGAVVELLSYELTADELLTFAASLEVAGPEEWQAVAG